MGKCRAVRLTVESMESRALLTATSVSGVMPTGSSAIINPPPPVLFAPPVNIHAAFKGSYVAPSHNPDGGDTVSLLGSGNVAKFGHVVVAGTISGPGFIANGQAGGYLYLITKRGNIILNVTGPTQPGFSVLPNQFQFTVVSGTGSFKNAHGGGQLSLNLVGNQNLNSLPHGRDGHFSLKIDTGPIAVPAVMHKPSR